MKFFLDKMEILENYIIKGKVKDLKADIFLNDYILSKTNLNFFADKEDILIKNIIWKN